MKHKAQKTSGSKLQASGSRFYGQGFTLIELIITMAIITVLAFGVAFILDPFELIDRAHDSQRAQDLNTIEAAIKIARQEAGGNFDPDGPYDDDMDPMTQSCSGEGDQRIFVSVPLGNGESDPTDLPAGWLYARVLPATLQNIDGTGWLPVDFSAAAAAGASLSHLPLDPVNTFASGYYYTYVCDRSGFNFELTTRLASKKHRTGGSNDVQSTDGGDDIFAFETGTDLELDPKAPIAYWGLNGGTSGNITDGTTAGFEDSSGNGHDGTLDNATGADVAWVEGVLDGAVRFDSDGSAGSGDSRIDLGESSVVHDGRTPFTVCAWVNIESRTPSGSQYAIFNRCDDVVEDGCWGFAIGDWADGDDALPTLQAYTGGSWTNFFGSDHVAVNQWEHVCARTDATGTGGSDHQEMFRNGHDEGDIGVYDAPAVSATVPQSIGAVAEGASVTEIIHGALDEIGIYDRELTQTEIDYQYQSLRP